VPIPGTKKLSRLEENLGAVNVVLTSADLKTINEAAAKLVLNGERLRSRVENDRTVMLLA